MRSVSDLAKTFKNLTAVKDYTCQFLHNRIKSNGACEIAWQHRTFPWSHAASNFQ